MGVKTCEAIIRRGVYLAGVPYNAADTKPLSDLKDWLRSIALSWPWPETSSIEQVTLPAGSYRVGMGMGEDWAGTRYIQRLDFPFIILRGPDMLEEKIYQQSVNSTIIDPEFIPKGTPDKAGYTRIEAGAVVAIFNKKLSAELKIQIPYQYDPAVNYTLTEVPWYMNDDTMEYFIAFKAAESANGPAAENTLKFENDVSTKVRNDKVKFGIIESTTLKMNRRPSLT